MATRRACLFVDIGPHDNADGSAQEAPTEFQLFKTGLNDTEKGTFVFSERSAQSVIAEWKRRGNRLTGDYEHETLLVAKRGGKAVASCKSWVPEVRADGLWATKAKWTRIAKGEIEDGLYNFVSPLFEYDDASMEVLSIINFGLTNLPARNGIAPLLAASLDLEEETMDELEKANEKIAALTAEIAQLKTRGDREAIAALSVTAGLEPGANVAALSARVRELGGFRSEILTLAGANTPAEALGRFTAWKGDAAKAEAALSRVAEIEQKSLDDELESVMAKADAERKVTKDEAPTFRTIAIRAGKVAREGLDALKACIAVKVPVAALSNTAPVTGAPASSSTSAAALSIPTDVMPFLNHLKVDTADLAAFKADKAGFMKAEAAKRAAMARGAA